MPRKTFGHGNMHLEARVEVSRALRCWWLHLKARESCFCGLSCWSVCSKVSSEVKRGAISVILTIFAVMDLLESVGVII